MKCKNVMVLFSYLLLLLYFPFMEVLTWSGGGCPHQFLLHIRPSGPLHLHIRLPLPLSHNLIPRHSFLYLPLHIPLHLFTPCVTLSISISLPLTLPNRLLYTHEPIPLTLYLLHNICPPSAHLSISLPFHLPQPPYLSQRLPRCHSYTNTIQIIQCI